MHPKNQEPQAPILEQKFYEESPVFKPENLLREAKRQKHIAEGAIPSICILDPDGDILQYVVLHLKAKKHPHWACYHTDLYAFEYEGIKYGIIGQAVGAPFAVLLAEQLFVSGCKLLISITSAGQILERMPPPYFILIRKAVRDEGTSFHYQPPAAFSYLDETLHDALSDAFEGISPKVFSGSSWTTDAPYRETEPSIQHYQKLGIDAVEMESAALYAFATAKKKPVVCFAHVTNQMASIDGDFEKGEANGSIDALTVVAATVKKLNTQ